MSLTRLHTLALSLGLLAASSGCTSLDNLEKLQKAIGPSCVLDSDCVGDTVCLFGRCREECTTSDDCEFDQRCVEGESGLRACLLPDETECSAPADCPYPMVCGVDGECRNACSVDGDCVPPQLCSYGSCAEPSELDEGSGELPVPDDFTGEGQPCQYNSECPGEYVCVNQYCGPECKGPKDCAPGETCSPEGLCVAVSSAECAVSSDCPLGEVCSPLGNCEPPPPGPVECMTTADCPSGDVCAPDGVCTVCLAQAECAHLTDVCNEGACVNGACQKLPANQGGVCDDGDACTLGDSCQGGACQPGAPKTCKSSDVCHVAQCDAASGACVEVPGNDGASCQDLCTPTGVCSAGACAPTSLTDCSFLDSQCGVGVCDVSLGCVVMPNPDGTACDDGLFCTVGDKCTQGQCTGAPNLCDGNGNGCFVGQCDEGQNQCITVPGNDGGPCNDGNPCTAGEVCAGGSCIGGLPANQGAACDDSDACTGGTTCANGVCANATSEITACVDGDKCCPAGCAVNGDNDCLFWKSGVQQGVEQTALTGWSQCYADTYANGNTAMGDILKACDKGKLLMACRPTGASAFTLLAMAPRPDVTHDCGTQNNCVHQANGVGWYYSDQWSWGFAPGGLPVSRNSCDVESSSPEQRMCWHSGGGNINSGYRCGNSTSFDTNWERVVFEAD